ncbi:MAG: transposase [Verrucomicrobiae bacterium]|nr:transposase [Verrucomicrobiae bacterium]
MRYTPEQKQALVEAYEASGLSCPRFAALHGVNYQTLVSWLKKRRQGATDHPVLRSMVPAELEGPPPRNAAVTPMEILLPCGVRLAVHTSAQMNMAATLIRELQKPRSC